MKKILFLIFSLILVCNVFAQNQKPLVSKKVSITSENVIAQINAKAEKNISYSGKENTFAVLKIYVDKKFSQDLVLFYGNEFFNYNLLLPKLTKTNHLIEIQSLNPNFKVTIKDLKIKYLPQTEVKFSPCIHSRKDANYTDMPLYLYYETKTDPHTANKIITYTIIMSNEDGGTPTELLYAKWGRTTDIEWIYEVTLDKNNKIVSEIIQGAGHKNENFTGEKISNHPLIYISSTNNVFSSSGEKSFLFCLEPNKFTSLSREGEIDKNPWIYKVMAEELVRENKVETPSNLATLKPAHPTNYLYVEYFIKEGLSNFISLNINALLAENGTLTKYPPENFNPNYRISAMNNYLRTALKMPENFADKLQGISITLNAPKKAKTKVTGTITKLFILNKDFSLKNLITKPIEFELDSEKREEVVKLK